jgi:uncharacterized protein YegP (UPF0339 family)
MTTQPWLRVYEDKPGEWRWTFIAGNGRKIADSGEGYHNKADCLKAIALLRNHVASAPIREQQRDEQLLRDALVRQLGGGQ